MESKIGPCGGSGFALLLAKVDGKEHRLAYLQIIRDVPPCPDGTDGSITLKFYQLDGPHLWEDMLHDHPNHFSALQFLAKSELAHLVKLIKHPVGKVRIREYDITRSDWVADISSNTADDDMITKPFVLPKQFTIHNITSRLRPDMGESTP